MPLDLSKFMGRFAIESRDHLKALNEGLVRLEKEPEDERTINALFRSAHSIKGSARMMKVAPIAAVGHRLEDILGALRDKKIRHSRDLADVLFRGIDVIAGMVDQVAAGQTPDADTEAICTELAQAAEGLKLSGAAGQPAPVPVRPTRAPSAGEALPNTSPEARPGNPVAESALEAPVLPVEKPVMEEAADGKPARDSGTAPGHGQTVRVAGETVRVDAERLDELIRLMGEIVSHQNRLKRRLAEVREMGRTAGKTLQAVKRLAAQGDGPSRDEAGAILVARALSERLGKLAASMQDDASLQELLTSELQEKALLLRMVPLSTVFDTFPRAARDLGRALGKEVDLTIEGGEIGLDKKMIERIGDPLLHLLRNAVDHGIESREDRRRAGKPERGQIRLSAAHDAGSVAIELADDGAGISLERIREKALKQGLLTEEELRGKPEGELVDLIFRPGFSTSPMITDLSGRGVGMDVVKRSIVEEMKGSIRVETRPRGGTRFCLRIPMTLSLMRVLMVSVAGVTYAVDVHMVSEVIRVRIEEMIPVLGKRAIRLREEVIPVVRLADVVKPGSNGGKPDSAPLVLVVRDGARKLGLVVDALIDEEDAVIKALPPHMKRLPLVSGVSISGGNEVITILHVPGIVQAARHMKEAHRRVEKEVPASRRILVVDDSVNTREIEKSILEAYGYVVDISEDGLDALERTRETKYDLIVTDVEMPRLDGFSLTGRLRQDQRYRDTPIVIVTSLEKEEDKKRGLAVGANAYIVKGSFDQSSLLETVQSLIG